jgi:hypothetical protein
MKDIITGAKKQKQLRAAKQGKVRKAVRSTYLTAAMQQVATLATFKVRQSKEREKEGRDSCCLVFKLTCHEHEDGGRGDV